MTLNVVGFALSNRCLGKCNFCPATRGTRYPTDMPFELIKKIIGELASPTCPLAVDCFNMSENGDALLNKDFLEILRYIRKTYPKGRPSLISNFALLTRDIAEVLLKENLIFHVCVNLDGHDESSYTAQKGLSLKTLEQNLHDFMEIRNSMTLRVHMDVNVLTLKEYASAVQKYFGKPPSRLHGPIPDTSYEQIVEKWRPIIGEGVDFVHWNNPFMWAERAYVNPDEDQTRYVCPNYSRMQNEAFIAPNGDWYICCYDDNQSLTYGNLWEHTLKELYDSERRNKLLFLIGQRRYKEVGYPCNTVKACQMVSA